MREIDWQIIPSRNVVVFKLIAGTKEEVFTEAEFEQLLAKGDGMLMELDRIKRKERQ